MKLMPRSFRDFIRFAAAAFFIAVILLTASDCGGNKQLRASRGRKGVNPAEPAAAAVERRGGKEAAGAGVHTEYGFFPGPPDLSRKAVLSHFEALGRHADFILLQPNVPWKDFADGRGEKSAGKKDLRIQAQLGRLNGLDAVFVLDPLNGLDRREFYKLPEEWEPSFGDSRVRSAFTNFAMWVLEEFSPAYIGLASEINTYMDAHPGDADNFISLYSEVYDLIKAESEETNVFVTFQWDDLNNMFPEAAEGRNRLQTNWEQVDAFEPKLDLCAISSYPYFVFHSGTAIPDDYYTPLKKRAAYERAAGPIAFAEGGYSSHDIGTLSFTPDDQAAYIKAVQEQLGEDLVLWVNLLLDDLDMDFYSELLKEEGRPVHDVETLSMFSSVGLRDHSGSPKPALELWDEYRQLEN